MDINGLEALGAINRYFTGHSYQWMTPIGATQGAGVAQRRARVVDERSMTRRRRMAYY